MKTSAFSKTIVLVGGGHSHVEVIRQFAMNPVAGVRLVLISEEVETPYSGMIPGLIAGHYSHDECHISLGPLCVKAGVRLHKSKVVGIDLNRKCLHCQDRPPLAFDLLSINTGSTPSLENITGSEHAIAIKPIRSFLDHWHREEKKLFAQTGGFDVVVIGGGAAGVEVSLCLNHRLAALAANNESKETNISVCLVTDKPRLLENHSPVVMNKFLKVLNDNNIRVELNQPVSEITQGAVETRNGLKLNSDVTVVATHASPPGWLRDTELELDANGFIKVDGCLKSVSHGFVFVAGDIASHEQALPKNGVHAVRQGLVLAQSLKRAIQNREPLDYVPQKRTLALISTGNKYAIASYGNLALEGKWLWKLKHWIDVRWMKKYTDLSMVSEDDNSTEDEMRCGGCGSKISGVVLESVLAEVKGYEANNLLIGLDSAEDSAVFSVPEGHVVVKTVDQFKSFIDDPYLFGMIAANHGLNDIFAMGAKPSVAMALVTLPYAVDEINKNELSQILSGINETLEKCNVALVGGHTGEGAEMSIGITITGFSKPEDLLRKSGLKPGDAIVLTRPLGSGALLAAYMRAKIDFDSISRMLGMMTQTNLKAMEVLKKQNASACTDVTGFGLLGHLGEMSAASQVHIELQQKALPVYEGVLDVFSQNIFSTLHADNQSYARKFLSRKSEDTTTNIMFDPQTSGGLLFGVNSSRAESTIKMLRAVGDTFATVIGTVKTGEPGKISISQGKGTGIK